MTLIQKAEVQSNVLLEAGVRSPNHSGAREFALPNVRPQPGLTSEEMQAVVTRNSIGSVHHTLADGAVRTNRVRYAQEGRALFIPAWTSIESWYAARLPALRCDISEVDQLSCWRYVWLCGQVTPLHPTGAVREREAWRQGIAVLRRVIIDMAPMDELAVANFGIVRMDIESWDGAMVRFREADSLPAVIAGAPSRD